MRALFLDLIMAHGVLQYEPGVQGPLTMVYQLHCLNCSKNATEKDTRTKL